MILVGGHTFYFVLHLLYDSTLQTLTNQSPLYLFYGFKPFLPLVNIIISNYLPNSIHKSLTDLQNTKNTKYAKIYI